MTVAALVFAGEAGALQDWHKVAVTPAGPVPKVVRVFRSVSSVAWIDRGSAARGIVFLDGTCRARLSTERSWFSPSCVTARLGRHPYRIVGLSGPASRGVVVVQPLR